MKTSVIIAAAAALSATSPAYASRPATPAEARVFRDVAAYLHTPEPVVVVDDSIDSEDTWGNANGERIALSRLSAGEARIYARAVSKPTLKGRRRALSACYDVCQNAIRGALHESVHYSRWTLGLLDSATYDPVLKLYPREEGIAESVAIDQACPFEYRVVRTLVRDWDGQPSCGNGGTSYGDEVDALRSESARAVGGAWKSTYARTWRLELVKERT